MLNIYKGKKVWISGITGFKGTWLAFMLLKLGAIVKGYALPPNTIPNHYDSLNLDIEVDYADIRDIDKLDKSLSDFKPEIVFHLAAQALVRKSYINPLKTFNTNIMGTVNLLEVCRNVESVKAIINVTTDKIYENIENGNSFMETDRLGGYDPYSTSKVCSEHITKSYRDSFYNLNDYGSEHNTLIATVRAGNVVGGGDWCMFRLIPDIIINALNKIPTHIRSPNAIRPWQHVLEPLTGYLQLGIKLYNRNSDLSGAWNFASKSEDQITVKKIIKKMGEVKTEFKLDIIYDENDDFHEAEILKLNSDKALNYLKWERILDIDETIKMTMEWYQEFHYGNKVITDLQINRYFKGLK